jgi:hypothetical protein
MDSSRVSAVWLDRANDTASGDTLSCPCGFEGHADRVRDVLTAADRAGGQAGGTVRAVRVGRPRLVGVTTLSPSQRTTHRPEYRPP